MIETIIGILVGSVIAWLVTHYYYKRSSSNVPEWAHDFIKKLPSNPPSREALIDMVHEFLEDEPMDPYFGIVACPQCKLPLDQMKRIIGHDPDLGDVYAGIDCPECGWST